MATTTTAAVAATNKVFCIGGGITHYVRCRKEEDDVYWFIHSGKGEAFYLSSSKTW